MRIFIITLLTLLYFHANAQNDYIITNNNDTLYGNVIDRKEGAFPKLYKKIKLKNGGLFTKKYSAKQIKAYKKGNNYFESVWWNSSSHFFKETILSTPNQGSKIFLKVVISDYLSLYNLEFQEQGSSFIDYIPYYKKQDQNNFVRVTQGVLGLKKKSLVNYFSDCPELAQMIENKEIKSSFEVAQYYNDWIRKKDK